MQNGEFITFTNKDIHVKCKLSAGENMSHALNMTHISVTAPDRGAN